MVRVAISRRGSTIKQITHQTRARVDVNRKNNVDYLEKSIRIYSNPKNY